MHFRLKRWLKRWTTPFTLETSNTILSNPLVWSFRVERWVEVLVNGGIFPNLRGERWKARGEWEGCVEGEGRSSRIVQLEAQAPAARIKYCLVFGKNEFMPTRRPERTCFLLIIIYFSVFLGAFPLSVFAAVFPGNLSVRVVWESKAERHERSPTEAESAVRWLVSGKGLKIWLLKHWAV